MGAVPKNKISRSERGKRRQGNKPQLNKNIKHHSVPLHKRGLVAQIFKTLDLNKSQ